MKLDELAEKIKDLGLKLPKYGTGKDGKLLKSDLTNFLGDNFAPNKYRKVEQLVHLQLRRSVVPMKAYRYNELNPNFQGHLWTDSNQWVAEEKLNGWRMLITYTPETGFNFWGGNLSEVDFLPLDYTDNVLLTDDKVYGTDKRFHHLYDNAFVLDGECICNDTVEMADGQWSTTTLDAVKAIVGCDKQRSYDLQVYDRNTLEFHVFDYIPFDVDKAELNFDITYVTRRVLLQTFFSLNSVVNFKLVPSLSKNKKSFLNDIWRKGGEGVVLKNISATYVNGSRRRDCAIKVKRTMSGQVGDDIDAFIVGSFPTPEWQERGLIGGVNLAVMVEKLDISYGGTGGMKMQPHIIASVSSMPNYLRKKMTAVIDGFPELSPEFKNRVVVVDGQELSSRNQRIMHATVDWDRGFRDDKNADDCLFNLETVKEEMF